MLLNLLPGAPACQISSVIRRTSRPPFLLGSHRCSSQRPRRHLTWGVQPSLGSVYRPEPHLAGPKPPSRYLLNTFDAVLLLLLGLHAGCRSSGGGRLTTRYTAALPPRRCDSHRPAPCTPPRLCRLSDAPRACIVGPVTAASSRGSPCLVCIPSTAASPSPTDEERRGTVEYRTASQVAP
ncbi:hypothetical protein VTN02DRAFT_2825 [Thermoascus thermophilus]